MNGDHHLLVSVVIPLLNEEENIGFLYEELKGVLTTLEDDHEIIFIDDGSKDSSLSILQGLQTADDKVVVVSFRRNFGQTAAMAAGFDYARGDVIITMDADLQNDPTISRCCSTRSVPATMSLPAGGSTARTPSSTAACRRSLPTS